MWAQPSTYGGIQSFREIGQTRRCISTEREIERDRERKREKEREKERER